MSPSWLLAAVTQPESQDIIPAQDPVKVIIGAMNGLIALVRTNRLPITAVAGLVFLAGVVVAYLKDEWRVKGLTASLGALLVWTTLQMMPFLFTLFTR